MADAWNTLAGRPRCTKGDSNRPRKGDAVCWHGGAERANTDQEGKTHSYSARPCAEFYFSFYLFLLLKPCFSP